MATPSQELPLIARQHLVEQVLDRLARPDDVRELPKKFIQPARDHRPQRCRGQGHHHAYQQRGPTTHRGRP